MSGPSTTTVGTHAEPVIFPLTYNDSTHVYMLDSVRCRSMTNIAKIPCDDYTVNQWRHRMAAIGFILDPSLLEDIAAHRDDAGRCADIVQRAIELAGGDAQARRGTQYHTASEFHDLDQPLLTPQQQRDASVWARTLDAYGITVDERWIERILLYPNDHIAGRIDRYSWMGGELFDIDTKTGTNAWRYPHATAVQLALHVRAPLIAGESSFRDGIETITEWFPQPAELRRDIAYILSMPTREDADIGQLWRFNLTGKFAGHAAAEMAITARHFQMNGDLCEMVPVPLRPAPRPLPEYAVPLQPLPADAQVQLVERIMALAELDRARLRGAWKAELLPSIGSILSPDELRRALMLVDAIDPFRSTHTEADIARHPSNGKRQFDKPDEGDDADVADVAQLSVMYLRLPDRPKARINELAEQAAGYGLGFHVAERNSRRRYFLVQALTALAINDVCDDGTLLALVAAVVGNEEQSADLAPVGAWVGSLNADQAALFARTVGGFLAGQIALAFTDSAVTVTPPDPSHNDTTQE